METFPTCYPFDRHLLVDGKRSVFTCNDLVNVVCKTLGVTRAEVQSKTRKVRIVYPRHIILYMLCRNADLPLSEIAMGLGLSHHTSVIHARDNVEHEIKVGVNPQYAADIKEIAKKLGYAIQLK